MQTPHYKTLLKDRLEPVELYEKCKFYEPNDVTLLTPEQIADFMKKHTKMHENTVEYLYMLCLDKKGHPVAIFTIAKGVVDATYASPRDAILNAVLVNAVNVVLLHNHPSGDADISDGDIDLTKGFMNAFDICGMYLLDHIIVTRDEYASIRHKASHLWD